MDALTYVDTVNTNLICCICRNPFLEPTATTTCTHTFCKSCIAQALAVASQCPVDRSPLTSADLQPASTIVRNLVDELLVECPNKPTGCASTCQRQLLSSHLNHECLHVPVPCHEKDCNEVTLRKDTKQHSLTCVHRLTACEACGAAVRYKDLDYHADQCPAAELACPNCTLIIPRKELTAHQDLCPEHLISCTHSAHGCAWMGPRRKLSEHISSCSYESLKGFFAINSRRISDLEAENSSLKVKVHTLERSIASVRRDADSARSSLGPWFHPSGSVPPTATTPQPRQERHRRRMSIPLHAALFNFPGDTDNTENPRALPNPTSTHVPASMFPPETFGVASEAPDTPPGEPSPSSYFPYLPEGAQPAVTSYAHSQVAPIDLSTSLEGCLTSLRNSVVTLSASLDSLERRQDIALTTETLRMHEDVGSLRAIVHGLRMQVHTIMMDRNWQASGRSGNGDNDNNPIETSVVSSAYGGPPRFYARRPSFSTANNTNILIGQSTSIRRTTGMENKL